MGHGHQLGVSGSRAGQKVRSRSSTSSTKRLPATSGWRAQLFTEAQLSDFEPHGIRGKLRHRGSGVVYTLAQEQVLMAARPAENWCRVLHRPRRQALVSEAARVLRPGARSSGPNCRRPGAAITRRRRPRCRREVARRRERRDETMRPAIVTATRGGACLAAERAEPARRWPPRGCTRRRRRSSRWLFSRSTSCQRSRLTAASSRRESSQPRGQQAARAPRHSVTTGLRAPLLPRAREKPRGAPRLAGFTACGRGARPEVSAETTRVA